MKTLVIAPSCKQLFYSLFVGMIAFTSCTKETASNEEAMTSEEAAEVMSNSMTDEEEGFAAYAEGHASVTAENSDSSHCEINETVIRTGKFVSKMRRKLIFTKETTFRAVKVVVNRTTRRVVSGTVEIIVKGTNSLGGSFYYTGTFTFHGEGQGSLKLQNGQVIHLQW